MIRPRLTTGTTSTPKRVGVAGVLALVVCASPASAAHGGRDQFKAGPFAPVVKLAAKSPQVQGNKVFVHVKASTSQRLESLRLTGRIRVAGKTTYFEPNRAVEVKAGSSHTFSMRQDDPDQRRIVRKAMKRGKDLAARIRGDFHTQGGDVIVRKVRVGLVYRDAAGE